MPLARHPHPRAFTLDEAQLPSVFILPLLHCLASAVCSEAWCVGVSSAPYPVWIGYVCVCAQASPRSWRLGYRHGPSAFGSLPLTKCPPVASPSSSSKSYLDPRHPPPISNCVCTHARQRRAQEQGAVACAHRKRTDIRCGSSAIGLAHKRHSPTDIGSKPLMSVGVSQ